jgi:hypothetical protein
MKSFLILLVCLLAGVNAYANMILLGETTETGSGGGSAIFDSMFFEWSAGMDEPFMENFPLFPAINLFDSGRTFYATSSTAGFDGFAAALTDGKDYGMAHNGYFTPESFRFTKHVQSFGPDFVRYEIDMITLTVNSFTLKSPGDG